jgi:hypothetical protein
MSLAASVALLLQLGLLLFVGRCASGAFEVLAVFGPSLLPTVALMIVVRRRCEKLPGEPVAPILISAFSWYAALLIDWIGETAFWDLGPAKSPCAMMLAALVGGGMSALAVQALVRRFQAGPALAMLGVAFAAVGLVFPLQGETLVIVVVTLVWTAAMSFLAGVWIARVVPPRGAPVTVARGHAPSPT